MLIAFKINKNNFYVKILQIIKKIITFIIKNELFFNYKNEFYKKTQSPKH